MTKTGITPLMPGPGFLTQPLSERTRWLPSCFKCRLLNQSPAGGHSNPGQCREQMKKYCGANIGLTNGISTLTGIFRILTTFRLGSVCFQL
jgi:hypothetical protein